MLSRDILYYLCQFLPVFKIFSLRVVSRSWRETIDIYIAHVPRLNDLVFLRQARIEEREIVVKDNKILVGKRADNLYYIHRDKDLTLICKTASKTKVIFLCKYITKYYDKIYLATHDKFVASYDEDFNLIDMVPRTNYAYRAARNGKIVHKIKQKSIVLDPQNGVELLNNYKLCSYASGKVEARETTLKLPDSSPRYLDNDYLTYVSGGQLVIYQFSTNIHHQIAKVESTSIRCEKKGEYFYLVGDCRIFIIDAKTFKAIIYDCGRFACYFEDEDYIYSLDHLKLTIFYDGKKIREIATNFKKVPYKFIYDRTDRVLLVNFRKKIIKYSLV